MEGWNPPADAVLVEEKQAWTPPSDAVVAPDTTIPTVTLDQQTLEAPGKFPTLESEAKPSNMNQQVKAPVAPDPLTVTIAKPNTQGQLKDYYAPLANEIGHQKYSPVERSIILKTADTFQKNPLYKKNVFEGEINPRDTYFDSLEKQGIKNIDVLKQGVYDELAHRKPSLINEIAMAPIEAVKGGVKALGEMAPTAENIANTIGEGAAKGENEAEIAADIVMKPIGKAVDAAFGLMGATPHGAAVYSALKGAENISPEVAKGIHWAMAPGTMGAEKLGLIDENSPEYAKSFFKIIDAASVIGVGIVGKYVKDKINKPPFEIGKEAAEKAQKMTPEQQAEIIDAKHAPETIEPIINKIEVENELKNTDQNSPLYPVLTEKLGELKTGIDELHREIASENARMDATSAEKEYLQQTKEKLIASKEGKADVVQQSIDESVARIDEQLGIKKEATSEYEKLKSESESILAKSNIGSKDLNRLSEIDSKIDGIDNSVNASNPELSAKIESVKSRIIEANKIIDEGGSGIELQKAAEESRMATEELLPLMKEKVRLLNNPNHKTHTEVSEFQKDLSTEIDNNLSAEKEVLKQNLTPEGVDEFIGKMEDKGLVKVEQPNPPIEKSKSEGKAIADGKIIINEQGYQETPVNAKAAKEYETELKTLQDKVDTAKKELRTAEKKLANGNQLFENIAGQEVEAQQASGGLKPFNDKLSVAEKAVRDFEAGKEKYLSRYDNQGDLFNATPPGAEGGIKSKPNGKEEAKVGQEGMLNDAGGEKAPVVEKLKGADRAARGIENLMDKWGGKKNLTEQEKSSMWDDFKDIAIGLSEATGKVGKELLDEVVKYVTKKIKNITEADIRDMAKDFMPDMRMKSLATKAARDSEFNKYVKDKLEENGLTYEIRDHKSAGEAADKFISEVGVDEAYNQATNIGNKMEGDNRAMVIARSIDEYNRLEKAADTPEQKEFYQERQAEGLETLDEMARTAGQFISALHEFYKTSPAAFEKYLKNKENKLSEKELSQKPTGGESKKEKINKGKKDLTTGAKEKAAKETGQFAKDMQKKSNLSPEKTARKQELKNKFTGFFNESTNLIKLVADKEFREYGKLIIEEGAADFKAFAKRATKELGNKVKPILKKWYQASGGQEDVTGLTKKFEKALADGNKKAADTALAKLQNISKDEGLWGQYADEAAARLKARAASGLIGDAKQSPPLQSFVDGLVKNLNQKIAESLPELERIKATKRPAIEIIADAIKNKEKYKDVWDKTQAELRDQFKNDPESLAKLDEYFGEIMDKPFSDRLAVEAVNDIVGKHVQSLINMQDKGFDISSYKDEVIEKLIHEAGIKESDAKQLIDAAVEELSKRETIAKDKLQERKNKAEKIKEAAKTKAQELNKKGVNKPLWEPRKQSASESLAKTLEGQILDKSPKQKTAVEEFANRVVSNLSKSAREALATTKKGFDGLSPIQKLAEIVRNKDKYQEVINDAQKQIIDKYKDNPTVLALLDDALFKIGDKPFSEQGLTDALKSAAKKENIDVGKLAEEHFKAEEQASEVLKQKLIDEAGLSDAAATQLSEALQKKFNELVTAKRKQILERMFPKTPLQKLPGLKGKHEKANENIVKAINAGAFDGSNFEKLFYEKFGLIDVNKPEVSAKLKDFAEKLHDNKNKSNPLFYDKIMQDMLDYMQNQRKENKLSEGVINQMYAHMLYGQDTHIKNMSYNVQTTIKSIASLSAQNTKYAKEAVKVFINDLYRGKLEAGGIMMEGYNKSGIPSTVPRSINERTGGAWGKYVSVPFRLLSAADASLNFPSRAIKQFAIFVEVAIAKNKELPKDQRLTTSEIIQTVKDQMGYDANAINSAHAEALTQIKKFYGFEDLWIDGKRNPKYADAKYNNVYRDYERSVFNLIESTRDREVTLEAKEWADNTLLMGRPKGYFGVAADAINRLGHSMPVLKVLTTPFVNVPFNIAANLYEYSPAGFINVYTKKEGSVNSAKLLGEYHEISPRRRRDLALKATTGVLGMAAVYQLGNATYYDKKEGKRRPVMVVFGDGTGKFYENKKEESLKGSDKFQEYTIDFMGHRASYKTSPFAAWFIAEGARQDYIRYKATPTEKDNAELLNVVGYSTMKYITFIKDQAAVSGLMDLLNVGEKTQQWNDKTPVSEKISDQLSMQAAKIVRNITVPNFIPNTMREYKGLMEDPETGGRSFIQRLSKDVPFADQFSNQSEDHFGDKITQRFVVPSLWDTRKEDNKLYQMAKEHDYMDKLKFYTDRDIYVNGEYKWLSRDETDKINKLRNKIAGDNIKLRYDALNNMDNEDFKTEMNAIYLDAEKEAKTKMFGSWSNTLRPPKSVQSALPEYGTSTDQPVKEFEEPQVEFKEEL